MSCPKGYADSARWPEPVVGERRAGQICYARCAVRGFGIPMEVVDIDRGSP